LTALTDRPRLARLVTSRGCAVSHLAHMDCPPCSLHCERMASTGLAASQVVDKSSGRTPEAGSHRSRSLARMWDKRVDRWHAHVFDTPGFALLRTELLNQVDPQPGERIIDLGAGDGFLTLPLARSGAAVLAVDISPAMAQACADAAAREGLDVQTIVTDLAHLDLPVASADVIVSSYALHHLSDRDKRLLLERAHRWLAPGGRLVLADMMIGRGATLADRRIILAKIRSMLRKGPAGLWRIAKNAVRFALRTGSEQPITLAAWTKLLTGAGFTHVAGSHIIAEAGIVSARRGRTVG